MSFDNNLYNVGGGDNQQSSLIIARVTEIVLGAIDINDPKNNDFKLTGEWGSIGCIKFSILYNNRQGNSNNSYSNLIARPLFSNIKQYPLIGEIVLIIPGPSNGLNDSKSKQDYYYYPPFNTWNSVHHNAFPDLREYAEYIIDNKVQYNQVSDGNTQGNAADTSIEYPLGKTFKEKDIRDLLPFEGDFILEGRWGQSIRFGSTVKQKSGLSFWNNPKEPENSNSGSNNNDPVPNNGDPIIIISNYRGKTSFDAKEPYIPTVENINNDGSIIVLSHNQQVQINDLQLYPLKSFSSKVKITSDNVVTLQPIYKSNYKTSPQEQDNKELNA